MKKIILSLSIPFVFSACASVDTADAEPKVREKKVYVTGSSIPVKSSAVAVDVKNMSTEDMDAMRRNIMPPDPLGSKAR